MKDYYWYYWQFKVQYLQRRQQGEISLLVGITSVALAFGFLFGKGTNHNYVLLYQFASQYVWAVLFGLYGSVKTAGCYIRIPNKFRLLNSSIGIWLWLYVFLSFVVFDVTAFAPTEPLLLVPIFGELYGMFTQPIYNSLNRRQDELASKDNLDNNKKKE